MIYQEPILKAPSGHLLVRPDAGDGLAGDCTHFGADKDRRRRTGAIPANAVGQKGKRFGVFKFRTMVPDAERRFGITQARENDERITRIGRLLRAMGLDELPQIVNILTGDMSFVGPRSLAVNEVLSRHEQQARHLRANPRIPGSTRGAAGTDRFGDGLHTQGFIPAAQIQIRPSVPSQTFAVPGCAFNCPVVLDQLSGQMGNQAQEVLI